MNTPQPANIFRSAPAAPDTEQFTTLLEQQEVKLERIVSLGQRTPDGEWLQQEAGEWVLVLAGRAQLSFEGQARPLDLAAGDYLYIPPLARHRVERTDNRNKTVWLAVHVRGRQRSPAREDAGIEAVKVIRSSRRRRTVTARFEADTMEVRVPHTISEAKLKEIIASFTGKLQRKLLKKQLNARHDLAHVAAALNKQYFNGALKLNRIEYVTDQFSKFGCCDYRARAIRIAHHVAEMPVWVRDYVLIHELAHLVQPDHSPAFWALVNRYRHAERARGYLLAKGYELNDERQQE
jgi:hypothetical protein